MLKILSLCTSVALLLPNIADAEIVTWEGNGHSYEVVDIGQVTWEQARDYASVAKIAMGTAYLMTVNA